jgi:hypothetical protein
MWVIVGSGVDLMPVSRLPVSQAEEIAALDFGGNFGRMHPVAVLPQEEGHRLMHRQVLVALPQECVGLRDDLIESAHGSPQSLLKRLEHAAPLPAILEV